MLDSSLLVYTHLQNRSCRCYTVVVNNHLKMFVIAVFDLENDS